jgi:hypothetical protein
MVGYWSGTLTTEMVTLPSGQKLIDVCNETWRITIQTAAEFTGTFETSGGIITPCAESGIMKGSVSTEGIISGLTFSLIPRGQGLTGAPGDVIAPRACAHVSGDGVYTGGLVDNRSLTAQAAERTVCVGVYGYLQFDRSFVLAMSKP